MRVRGGGRPIGMAKTGGCKGVTYNPGGRSERAADGDDTEREERRERARQAIREAFAEPHAVNPMAAERTRFASGRAH